MHATVEGHHIISWSSVFLTLRLTFSNTLIPSRRKNPWPEHTKTLFIKRSLASDEFEFGRPAIQKHKEERKYHTSFEGRVKQRTTKTDLLHASAFTHTWGRRVFCRNFSKRTKLSHHSLCSDKKQTPRYGWGMAFLVRLSPTYMEIPSKFD